MEIEADTNTKADRVFSIMEGTQGPIQRVLDLFAAELADVRFADVDAATLARLAADADGAAEAVALAMTALESAQSVLKERQRVLLDYAQRALAYARVYAENDEALSARLETIALPRAARRVRSSDESLVLSPGPQAGARRGRRPRPVAVAELTAAVVSVED